VGPAVLTSEAPAGEWSFDPLQLALLAVVWGAYLVRARTLARRGRRPPTGRIVVFGMGVVVLVLALASPIDTIGEERLFSVHMIQHLAIGDLAAICLVLGVTGPVLRPVLAVGPMRRLRSLSAPLVALPLWCATLFLWHLPGPYEAALHHDTVHLVEHACFLGSGILLWSAVLEPLPGPSWFTAGWKLGYLGAAQACQILLASIFLWSGRVFYETYADAPRLAGISPGTDQALGGAVMLGEATVVMAIAFSWAFFGLLREGEVQQRLLERGASEQAAARAARYGRGVPAPRGNDG
jgi:cytochrome c oxidase assembly factor CtaG